MLPCEVLDPSPVPQGVARYLAGYKVPSSSKSAAACRAKIPGRSSNAACAILIERVWAAVSDVGPRAQSEPSTVAPNPLP